METLKTGDLVDIITPASPITKSELTKIEKFLHKKGLRTRFYMDKKLLLAKKQSNNFTYFAPELRFEQLNFALQNTESKAVWCARGGYGALELIPFLSQIKTAQNKMFIGFSDITNLTIFLNQKLNLPTIYGPMLKQLAFETISKTAEKNIFDLVFGKKNKLDYKLKALTKSPKNISASLVGGCLSVIAANFSTNNEIDFEDKILLLEDIDESGEKIDRYLEQFLQIMVLHKKFPQAIIFGSFKQEISQTAKKKNIDIAIANFVKKITTAKLDFAIFIDEKEILGHSKNIAPIIIGKNAKISDNFILQQV